MNLVSRFVRDESGATAIEYGLIAALISVAIIGIVTIVGTDLNTVFYEDLYRPDDSRLIAYSAMALCAAAS